MNMRFLALIVTMLLSHFASASSFEDIGEVSEINLMESTIRVGEQVLLLPKHLKFGNTSAISQLKEGSSVSYAAEAGNPPVIFSIFIHPIQQNKSANTHEAQ